jgi:predicted RNA-binding Zn ribbon-like protein
VDFIGYADRGATLLNAPLSTSAELRSYLVDRAWLAEQVVDRDAQHLQKFQRELREVFEAGDAGDDVGVVQRINVLLAKHPVTPHIAGHDTETWHLHVSNRTASVAELLVAEVVMGLAFLVCNLGAGRLGVCQAAGCDDVFVDTSPNRSRRYSSERCSSRANVAAYRARQKVDASASGGDSA